MMMMIPSKMRPSPFGCSRLSYFMLLSTSLLLLLLSNDDQVGVVAAFPIKASTLPGSTPSSSSSSSSSSTPDISIGTSTSRRQSQQYSTTEDVIAIAYNTDTDIDFPGKEFDFDEFTSSPPLSPMKLNREGNLLQLSLDDDQNQHHQPIVLLDGLSPDIWTAAEPITTSSSTTTTSSSSSFSSLVLQTPIPSVAIQSFPLGKFLSSSSDDKATTASASNQQQHHQHGHKFLAAARLNRYWMGPKFGGNHDVETEIPVDTQFMLVEIERPSSKDEKAAQSSSSSSPHQAAPPYYALIMPLVDGGYRSSLESSKSTIGNKKDDNDKDGHSLTLVSYSESGDNVVHDPSASAAKSMNALYVAVHDDPYELLRLGFQQVSEILGGSFETLDKKKIPSKFVNSFGWCSWDAFYSKVHPSGILEGVKCLSDAGVPAKNIILDDGWQQVSPPYLHQQEDDDKNKKKTSSLAASLSLSGSSDVMPPPPNSIDISSASSSTVAAAASIAVTSPPPAVTKTTTSVVAAATTVTALLKNPLETLSNIGGSLFGVIAGGVTRCYQEYVEKAPTGSFPNRVWTFMARYSPLNYGLWKFFDSETDFGRQLSDFNPNWKFLEDEEETETDQQQKNMDLKELVTTLKKDWKVNRVYCWHAMHGYWRGVSPELGKSIGIDVTQVKTRPSDHLLRIEPEMAFDPPSLFGVGLIGGKRDLAKFYKHLHEPLVKAGVDGVKIDVQSGVTAAGMRGKGLSDNLPLAKLYTQAMEESVSQNFPSAADDDAAADAATQAVECINCMCHSTENLYRYRKTAVARASDDFYPARPESHSVHLVNVAYNSLFLGEICLPDWDMFQSQHRSAELHAAARSIGGCPVYVSDKPGNHNVPLLKKLVLPDGSVLRAQKSGRPTRDCIFADVGRDGISALKVWNLNRQLTTTTTTTSSATTTTTTEPGRNEGCGGVVGAFNVQGVAWNFETNENEILDASPSTVTASVKPHDVDSLRRIDGPFAVWSHRTKSLRVLPTGGSTIETVLEKREWEVYTVQPVQRNEEFNVKWAPIGLGRMLNSGGALIDVGRLVLDETDGNGGAVDEEDTVTTIRRKIIQADITTRGPGYFVSYCQPRPSQVTIHDGSASSAGATQLIFHHDMQSGLLEFDLPAETIEGKAHHVTVKWEQR